MSKTILFWPDVYKEQGHWLPTLKWADALHNAGHIVKYMGIADCEELIASEFRTTPGFTAQFPCRAR